MNILVLNCGSSSLNYKVFRFQNAEEPDLILYGKAHRVGVTGTEPAFIEHHMANETERQTIPLANHVDAVTEILHYLEAHDVHPQAIGHRFVHGGVSFQETTMLSQETLGELRACLPLAPIHNPNSMSVIDACLAAFPHLPQFVTFDTAFHANLPEHAYRYALPIEFSDKYNLRKFGFHGLSYQYVSQVTARLLGKPLESLKMIACHLGTGGSSVAAIREGKSIDTSMGFSPLCGLMMSTRCGDLDAMIPLHLISEHGLTAPELTHLFNKKSGLLGVSGFSSDIRDITARLEEGEDSRARLALEMYTYRLKHYIGAYSAVLGGLDVLIFTDDIGAQSAPVRAMACAGLEFLGISLDQEANRAAQPDRISRLNPPEARVQIFSMPTDEEWVMAMEGWRLLGDS